MEFDSSDTGTLDESNTSLLQRMSGDGILNHQYGKRSKLSLHIDIESKERHARRKENDDNVKNMNVGGTSINLTNQATIKVNNSVYSRLPV